MHIKREKESNQHTQNKSKWITLDWIFFTHWKRERERVKEWKKQNKFVQHFSHESCAFLERGEDAVTIIFSFIYNTHTEIVS